MWDLMYGNHSSSQLMIFQISSTEIDQKRFPDPMGWIPGSEICKECEIGEDIVLKNKTGLGTFFVVCELIFDRVEHC